MLESVVYQTCAKQFNHNSITVLEDCFITQVYTLNHEPQSHTAHPKWTEHTKEKKKRYIKVLCSKSRFPQGKAALHHHRSRERGGGGSSHHYFTPSSSSYQSSSAKLPSSASGTWLLEWRWRTNIIVQTESTINRFWECVRVRVPDWGKDHVELWGAGVRLTAVITAGPPITSSLKKELMKSYMKRWITLSWLHPTSRYLKLPFC